MIPFASSRNMDQLRASADIIEERDMAYVEPGLYITYFGFCQPGTLLETEPKWSIMRIRYEDGPPYWTNKVTVLEWAEGSCAYNLAWDLRAEYNYSFKNF